MGLTDEQLICEAVECNHAGVGASTLERYHDHLDHFAQYLASVHKSDFYKANKKQVRLFMGHLEKQGGHRARSCWWLRLGDHRPQRRGETYPIDVVSEALRHKEIATTRRHYAPTKSDLAKAAIVGMRLS